MHQPTTFRAEGPVDGITRRELEVLLVSPIRGIDPPNGDLVYTEELLRHPPDGVRYTTYDVALADGRVRERYRRPPSWRTFPWNELGGLLRESLINRARRKGWLFREPFRHFELSRGAFDLVHSHVFGVALYGEPCPIVISNSVSSGALYRDGFRQPSRLVRLRESWDVWLARRTGVVHTSFPGCSAAAVIALSDYVRIHFLDAGVPAGSVTVVPPTVQVPAAPRVERDDVFRLGFIGHWGAKGGPTVLAAHRILRAEGYSCQLVVVGTEPKLNPRESEDLGVHWLPRKPHEELLRDVIPSLSAFAYPTQFDGLPVTVLEVMAAGVPVIVSDYRALPEVVDHGRAGGIVQVDNPTQLAASVRRLFDAHTRQVMGGAARRRIVSRYSAEVAAPMVGEVYRSVSKGCGLDCSRGGRGRRS